MKFTELYDHIWGAETDAERKRRLAALDKPTRTAWEIIQTLRRRKGFGWWWEAHDMADESRDEMFEDLKRTISTNMPEVKMDVDEPIPASDLADMREAGVLSPNT